MCAVDGHKAVKCVLFAVHTSVCHTHKYRTHYQLRHQFTKLKIMTISIKTKVLIEFGASEMMCVELRAKNL